MKHFLMRAHATLLVLLTAVTGFLAAGCGSMPTGDSSPGLPNQALLALHPGGDQVLVSWRDAGTATQARLIGLHAGASGGAPKPVVLPKDTFDMAWSLSADAILVTTWSKTGNQLSRLDLASGTRAVLYESGGALRFPMEIEDGTYVFLEALSAAERSSQWQRLASGRKTLLNPKIYRLAAPLEQIGGSLHLFEPTKEFRIFAGPLPSGLRELVTPTTWSIRCADKEPLSCVRNHFFMPKDGSPFSTMDVVIGGRTCHVAGRWTDAREVQISRDGSTVAFHARASREGVRAVYAIDTRKGCLPVAVFERDPA